MARILTILHAREEHLGALGPLIVEQGHIQIDTALRQGYAQAVETRKQRGRKR